MDQEYILRIIKGECSPDEREKFFEQISSDKILMQEYARLKNKHILATLPYSPSVKTLLNNRKPKRQFIYY